MTRSSLRLVTPAICCASIAVAAMCSCVQGQSKPTAKARVARSAKEVPFICGQLWIPQLPNTQQNNDGVIANQLSPGLTHLEGNFCWRFLEPKRDQWDFSSLRRAHRMAGAKGLKIVAFPWMQFAPQWFKETDDYVQLVELGTGRKVDLLSPWAPGTLRAVEHFYAGLKTHAGDMIDIISVGGPTSDFGEIGLVIGAPAFLPGKSQIAQHLGQDPLAWHEGLWCGDRYALGHFRQWLIARYGSVEKVNAAWATRYTTAEDIAFPDMATRRKHRRAWIDFIYWYQESQVALARKVVAIVRKHFPDIMLETKLGFGSDNPLPALDRTAVCRALSEFKPFTIRSTHAAGPNRGRYNRSYWFYKRMAPVCRRYGVGFGTEPPGGDLTVDELKQQLFEDASAGATYIFSYFQNYKLMKDTVRQFRRVLDPSEAPLVDIGVLYPTAQLLLDMSHFPPDQIAFCHAGRGYFDYDVIDENMIAWSMLGDYKVLIQTGGAILEQESIGKIDQWVRKGGLLIVRRDSPLESVEGSKAVSSRWQAGKGRALAGGAKLFAVGTGAVVVVDFRSVDALVASVVATLTEAGKILPALRNIDGFEGADDHTWTTQFPSRILRYDTRTRLTTIEKRKLPVPLQVPSDVAPLPPDG